MAVQADDAVTGNDEVRRLEERIARARTPARPQDARGGDPEGGAGPVAGKKTEVARDVAAQGRFPVKAVAETLGVARSNLIERLAGSAKPRRRYSKAQNAAGLPLARRLVDARPTDGYRRITALLNRDLAEQGLAPANHKRVYRLMKLHGLLLEKHGGQRPGCGHDGKVVVMRSDLRWCSDGFEFVCWNGEVVRGAFVLDAHDREVIAWRATAGAGISGSDIRDMMLEAVQARSGGVRAPHPVDWLPPTTARPTPLGKPASSQPSSTWFPASPRW